MNYFVEGNTNGKTKLVFDLRYCTSQSIDSLQRVNSIECYDRLPADGVSTAEFIHHFVAMLTRMRSDEDWTL